MPIVTSINVPELVSVFVSLWFTHKRLDQLEDMVDQQYSLADRQTELAEALYALQKTLRIRDKDYFNKVNASPLYPQKYDCANVRANVNTVRDLIQTRQGALRATSAYHHGQMRSIVQLTANSIVTLGAPKKLDTYRFEDALKDTSRERQLSNMVDSIATRFFSPAGVYASLGAYYERMTSTLARSASSGLNDVAYFAGRAYESLFKNPSQKHIRGTSETFDKMSEQRRLEIASGQHHRPTMRARRELEIASGRAGIDRTVPVSPTIQSVVQTRDITPYASSTTTEEGEE